MDGTPNQKITEELAELFGTFRAEWLKDRIFELYIEPDYFPQMTTQYPCVLIGGRGTGKTTVLRGLSYEGQFAIHHQNPESFENWKYVGCYYRVDTNRTTAFDGSILKEEEWKPIFAHYFNILISNQLVEMLKWYKLKINPFFELEQNDYIAFAETMHIQLAKSIEDLSSELISARRKFEAYINNIVQGERPKLSMQGAPIDVLCSAILKSKDFTQKTIFLIIDEFENFTDYQQQVVNSLIKHCGAYYTFKIGVRENGWRRRTTMHTDELLISPADYVKIDINERLKGDAFTKFALRVCNDRLKKIKPFYDYFESVESVLPSLSIDEEAELLGVSELVKETKAKLKERKILQNVDISNLEILYMQSLVEAEKDTYDKQIHKYLYDNAKWREQFENYKYALLYTIRRGKRGIRKYYCGWKTFNLLASSNIRYLVELVAESLYQHVRINGDLSKPIGYETQTNAAQFVGRKNLSELGNVSLQYTQLKKLVLGLGRVFQLMAADPLGHTPEVTQFSRAHLSNLDVNNHEVDDLLSAGVMHLALVAPYGTKPIDQGDTKDFDYSVHPIFAAFFEFSYRKKRKIVLKDIEILGLVNSPGKTIKQIISNQGRNASNKFLPEQLNLFSNFYETE